MVSVGVRRSTALKSLHADAGYIRTSFGMLTRVATWSLKEKLVTENVDGA